MISSFIKNSIIVQENITIAAIKRAFDSSHALNAAINQLPIYIITIGLI